MIRVLLDTDHVSLHERGHLPLHARLASGPPEEVAVSVVTVEEMLRGRLAILARRAEGEARVHAYGKLLETVLFYAVDQERLEVPKHPEAKLYPSAVVTLALLFAIKGGGTRAFYRWVTRDYLPL